MDDYRPPSVQTPRSTPAQKNPLTEMAPVMVPWTTLEQYFLDLRERAILDLTTAEDQRAIWQAQGKLTLVDELTRLRSILAVLDSQGKEMR